MKCKYRIKKIIQCLILSAGIVSCGSGVNSATQSQEDKFTPSPYNALALKGLINYDVLDAKDFYSKHSIKASQSKLLTNSLNSSSLNNCAQYVASPSSGWQIAEGFLNAVSYVGGMAGPLIPGIGGIAFVAGDNGFSFASSLITSFAPSTNQDSLNACLIQDEMILQSEIVTIESQVANIQQNVSALQNDFYNQQYEIAITQNNINQQNLQNALMMFLPINNNYTFTDQMLIMSQLLKSDLSAPTGASLESTSFYVMPRINLDALVIANRTAFQNNVNSLSGSYLPVACQNNCYASLIIDPDSALIKTFQSLFSALQAKMIALNNSSATSEQYNQTLDNYNNTVMSIYVQSLTALNSAYASEWLINKLNYLAYAQSSQPDFATSSLGQVPGTYYDYAYLNQNGLVPLTFTQNTESYNQAQLQLTKLYAARTNALYTTILNYIVTDLPNIQAYPFYSTNTNFYIVDSNSNTTSKFFSESDISSFALYIRQNVGKNVESAISMVIPSYLSGGWLATYNRQIDNVPESYTGLYYQYGGLRSLDCINIYESFTALSQTAGNPTLSLPNNQNCPAIFADMNGNSVNQSVYIPNQIIQVYMVESNLSLNLAESVTNNIAACDFVGIPGSYNGGGLYFWHPSESNNPMGNNTSSYMMCSLWSHPQGITPYGSIDEAVGGAYSYFINTQEFLNANGTDFALNTIAAIGLNPPFTGIELVVQDSSDPAPDPSDPSTMGTVFWNGFPMLLTAGDLTGVPLYSSNNIIMNNPNNNDYTQTYSLGPTSAGDSNMYFNSTPQAIASVGYIFNFVHPETEGLNIPIALSYTVTKSVNGNNFVLVPLCVFTQPVLVNTSSGMQPFCDYSQTYTPAAGVTYYGNSYLAFGQGNGTNSSYINAGSILYPAVSMFGNKFYVNTYYSNYSGSPTFYLNLFKWP